MRSSKTPFLVVAVVWILVLFGRAMYTPHIAFDLVSAVLFYSTLVILIYIYRKYFEIHGVAALLKTSIGIKFMDKLVSGRDHKHIGAFLVKISFPFVYLGALIIIPHMLATVSPDFFGWIHYGESFLNLVHLVTKYAFIVYAIGLLFRPFETVARQGVIAGYTGMIVIVIAVLTGFWALFFRPEAPPTATLIVPGVRIPGSPVFVPFWQGILSLFFVIVIHEFSHGIMSRVHNIKVNKTGVGIWAIFPLAFVEPDEKILAKKKPQVQNDIFAAGPYSNILTAGLLLLLGSLFITPFAGNMQENLDTLIDRNGVIFSSVQAGYPAHAAGVLNGTLYTYLNDKPIDSVQSFFAMAKNLTPGQNISMTTVDGRSQSLITVEHPNEPERGYIGVIPESNVRAYISSGELPFKFNLFLWFYEFYKWFFFLSLALGTGNLLPLGPVDGGRMFLLFLQSKFKDKRAKQVWVKISIILAIVLVVLIFVPIFKAIITDYILPYIS